MTALLFVLMLRPAGLEVSNRAPKADEWGYRPANASTVRLNPPSLTWVHEAEAASYTVQWSRSEDFAEAATAARVPWPTYTHHEPLALGAWHWRYRFVTLDG